MSDDELKNLKVGTTINQNGLSSWTSEKKCAVTFAENRSKQNDGKGVIFIEKDTKVKNAISIKNISEYPSENEVLYSAYQNFKINKIYSENNIKYIEIQEVA